MLPHRINVTGIRSDIDNITSRVKKLDNKLTNQEDETLSVQFQSFIKVCLETLSYLSIYYPVVMYTHNVDTCMSIEVVHYNLKQI